MAAVDAATLERRWLVENHGGSPAVTRVALDGAGERVAISTMSRIVARADGKDVAELPAHLGPFRFAPGDAYVVADGRDATVVLDGASLRVLYTRTEFADGGYMIVPE